MLVDRVGNIENTSQERNNDSIASLESQNQILVADVKTLNLRLENLVGKAKACEAINTRDNIIPPHKTTHVDNMRVISNLVVNDTEQSSIVPPANNSNREVADSLVNDLYKFNVDQSAYQNSTTSTSKKGTKEIDPLGDELDRIN